MEGCWAIAASDSRLYGLSFKILWILIGTLFLKTHGSELRITHRLYPAMRVDAAPVQHIGWCTQQADKPLSLAAATVTLDIQCKAEMV